MKKDNKKTLYINLQGGTDKKLKVRVEEERLIDAVQSRDAYFDEDMYNYGDMDNLPNSDRIMICQRKGVRQEKCPLN